MFCADYVAAFVYHAIFTIGSVNLVGKEVRGDGDDDAGDDQKDHDNDNTGNDVDHDDYGMRKMKNPSGLDNTSDDHDNDHNYEEYDE